MPNKVYTLRKNNIAAEPSGGMHSRPEPGESQRGPEEAQPPTCNTGAQIATVGNSLSSAVLMDHISYTVNLSSVGEVQAREGGVWTPRKGGFRGYTQAYERDEGGAKTIMGAVMPGHPGQIHVQLAGQAANALSYQQIQSLAAWVQDEKQGHFTRGDVAFDEREGVLNVDEIHQAVKGQKAVRRSTKWSVMESGSGAGEVGKTIYIGAPTSNTKHRIYDKAVQQRSLGKEVVGPWVRVETQYGDERADAIFRIIRGCPEEMFSSVAMSYLVQSLDFREITQDMPAWEKSRAERLPWWERFTQSMQGCKLVVQKVCETIERKAEWIKNAVAPLLAVFLEHQDFGLSWVEKVAREAAKFKWTQKHHNLMTLRPIGITT